MTAPILQNPGLTLAQSLNAILINPSGSLQFNPSVVGGPDEFIPIQGSEARFSNLAGRIFTTAESVFRPSHLGIVPVLEGERSTLVIEGFSADPTLADSDVVRLKAAEYRRLRRNGNFWEIGAFRSRVHGGLEYLDVIAGCRQGMSFLRLPQVIQSHSYDGKGSLAVEDMGLRSLFDLFGIGGAVSTCEFFARVALTVHEDEPKRFRKGFTLRTPRGDATLAPPDQWEHPWEFTDREGCSLFSNDEDRSLSLRVPPRVENDFGGFVNLYARFNASESAAPPFVAEVAERLLKKMRTAPRPIDRVMEAMADAFLGKP